MAGSRKRSSSPKSSTSSGKKKTSSRGGKSSSAHQTQRFPIQDIHQLLETKFPSGTVYAEAAVYLTGILEYLGAEILELSANAARARTSSTSSGIKVTLEDMLQAIESDAEIKELIDKVRKANNASEEK